MLIDVCEKLISRRIYRAVFVLPPGSAKSTYGSILFPAGYLARHPEHSVISCSYALSLVRRFGRKTRNLVGSDEFQRVFAFSLAADSAAADEWGTSRGGEYYAIGVQGGVTGRRADLIIYDDLIAGIEDAYSDNVRERTWDWLRNDVKTRLKPRGVELYIGTRWHWDDPIGRLIPGYDNGSGVYTGYDGQDYHVVNLPAIALDNDPLGRQPGEPLWPEYITKDMLDRVMSEQGGWKSRGWQSLYMGRPSPDEGGILSRKKWRRWEWELPDWDDKRWLYKLDSYDTAYSEKDLKNRSRSARTSWGVLKVPGDEDDTALVLVDAWADFVDYPVLRTMAKRQWKSFKPHGTLIEKKASGQSLLQDLRIAGVPLLTYQPDREKVTRAYAVQPMFESGLVWYVDTAATREVIDECARFPAGERDDYVDTVTQALLRMNVFRMARNPEDHDEDAKEESEARYRSFVKDRKPLYA